MAVAIDWMRALLPTRCVLSSSQAVARQGADSVSVRLSHVDTQSQAQLDGFKSRALQSQVAGLKELHERFDDAAALAVAVTATRRKRTAGEGTFVQLSLDGAQVVIQLNDPEHFNTFSTGLGKDMHCALQHVRVQPSVGCVVLQGAGAHFSAGGNPWHQHRSAHQLLATQHSRRTLTL